MKGTGKPDPDRNQQFKHIGKMRKLYLSKGWAVISIDAKKKELIGDFKSNGSEYRASKSARKVNDHDFGEQRVTPYGVYDCGIKDLLILEPAVILPNLRLNLFADGGSRKVHLLIRDASVYLFWRIMAAATVQTVVCSRSTYLT